MTSKQLNHLCILSGRSRKPTLSALITVGFLDFFLENPQMRDPSIVNSRKTTAVGFLDFYRYKVKKTHSCGFSSICSRKPTLSTLITVGFLDFCQENPQMRDHSGNFSLAIFFKHDMNIQFQESRSMSRKYCKKTFTRGKNPEKQRET